MSDDDEWQFPAPLEDPEARKSGEKGGGFPRIVPDSNFVEGDVEEDGRKDGPSCPFPHS
jgi:hypothetical protein